MTQQTCPNFAGLARWLDVMLGWVFRGLTILFWLVFGRALTVLVV